MEQVTIHSHGRQWEDAEIVGVGTDTLTGEDEVLIVQHPSFEGDLDFYAKQMHRADIAMSAMTHSE